MSGRDNVFRFDRNEASRKPRFKILNREKLLETPEPDWLIDGLFLQESLAQVFGEPDAWKTFLGIGVACSVATGKAFLGTYEPKCTGDVVYIYGEGGRGIGKRLRAWEMYHDCEATRFFGIAEPVDMLSNEPDKVIADIKAATLSPRLITLDTLARCFGDGDENSTKDMNAFVRGCDKLKAAFPNCTILVVHHSGWEGTRFAGCAVMGRRD
jgi:RecA-family ATPase